MATDYLPALVSPRLLPGYDTLAWLTGAPEMYWQLVAQAAMTPGATVVEIGCGTGNVLLRAKRAVPTAVVIGLDPDPEALAIAERKASEEGAAVQLDHGYAAELPYADGSVDRVLSSLMVHHLPAGEQVPAMREVRRVLAPGGSLHLVDLDIDPRVGGRMVWINRLLARLNHLGSHHGHGHGHGEDGTARPVPDVLADAGFTDTSVVAHGSTLLGALTFYRAA